MPASLRCELHSKHSSNVYKKVYLLRYFKYIYVHNILVISNKSMNNLPASYEPIGHMRRVIIAFCIVFVHVLFCLCFVYKFHPLWNQYTDSIVSPCFWVCFDLSGLIYVLHFVLSLWTVLCTWCSQPFHSWYCSGYIRAEILTQIRFDRATQEGYTTTMTLAFRVKKTYDIW